MGNLIFLLILIFFFLGILFGIFGCKLEIFAPICSSILIMLL